MAEFVGIKNLFDLFFTDSISARFKREALLVDRIGIIDLDVLLKTRQILKNDFDEVAWLYEKGIIFKPPDILRMPHPILNPFFDDVAHMLVHENIELKQLERRSRRQRKKQFFIERGMMSEEMRTRVTSIYLREKEGVDNCSLFTHHGPKDYLKFRFAEPRDTPAIVLKTLPVPSAKTSWEQITEFRSDPDSRSKFLALRNWMNDLSRTDLSPAEVEQKLEY